MCVCVCVFKHDIMCIHAAVYRARIASMFSPQAVQHSLQVVERERRREIASCSLELRGLHVTARVVRYIATTVT